MLEVPWLVTLRNTPSLLIGNLTEIVSGTVIAAATSILLDVGVPPVSFKPLIYLVILLVSFFASSPLLAQGPGVPNVPRTQGELLSPHFGIQGGRTAILAWHQDWLFIQYERPGSEPGSDFVARYVDISNPANPQITKLPGNDQATPGFNAHAYFQVDGVDGKGWGGRRIWTFGNGGAGFNQTDHAYPYYNTNIGIPFGRGRLFQPFEIATFWKYNNLNHDAVIYKRGEEVARWDHMGLTGVSGHGFMVGNILYFLSDHLMTGIAAYDITPSLNNPGTPPQLIGILPEEIGGYHAEVWGEGDKLYAVFPNRGPGHFIVADISDPSDMRVVFDEELSVGTPWWYDHPAYIQFQDNFMFSDRYKINMNNFEWSEVINPLPHGINVSQFTLPIGNLIVTGGKTLGDGGRQGAAIWAHQAAPDTKQPYVGYHIPKEDQTNYPKSGVLTLLIHETLRAETILNGTTFQVREVTDSGLSAPLAGQLIFTYNDFLQFTPLSDFKSNTTYQVDIVEGGIEDAVGNGIEGYSFRFSTGNTVVGGGGPQPTPTATPNPTPTATPTATPTPANSTLVVDAGSDLTVNEEIRAITLVGTVNRDSDEIESIIWRKNAGPDGVTLINSETLRLILTNLAVGSYEFILEVTASDGKSSSDTVLVTVTESEPEDITPLPTPAPSPVIETPFSDAAIPALKHLRKEIRRYSTGKTSLKRFRKLSRKSQAELNAIAELYPENQPQLAKILKSLTRTIKKSSGKRVIESEEFARTMSKPLKRLLRLTQKLLREIR